MNNVSFTEYFDDKSTSVNKNVACFAPIYGRGYEAFKKKTIKIEYEANIVGLTSEQVLFYLDFLSKTLDSSFFTYKVSDKKTIFFTLNCEKLDRIKALLYLTAFRYVDEFSTVVSELLKHKEQKIEQLFKAFQDIHFKDKNLSYRVGHTLIDSSRLEFAVEFENFKNVINNKKLKMVHHYFNSDFY